MQKDLIDFEESLCNFSSSLFSIGVANATDALELILMSLDIKPGDEIICSSHTMLASASAIKMVGAIPIPADIGSDNLLEPKSVLSLINSRTVGIMPTQLNGRCCDMDQIMKIATDNHLFVVEDSAQALGARFRSKHAGTFGYGGCISFFPAKVLGCLGDGGAVFCQDPIVFDKIYQLHDHGRNIDGEVVSWGRNSRLDNLNAAILDFKLKSYQTVIDRRRQIASIYNDNLKDIPYLRLPPPPDLSSQPLHYDVFQNYELAAHRRDDLRQYLKDHQIGTLVQWGGKGIHQWPHFKYTGPELPATNKFFEECIMLPMNVFLSDDDVHYVSETVHSFYSKL